ncbi:esterase [Methylobacterium aquaticum]|uniref:Esterase n=1 Tax=Methylobacterium aquaticum TaxID=270351 RepID=A0A0J6S8V8_9HYPH|nr:esterase [Methylobacterium aquaticum]
MRPGAAPTPGHVLSETFAGPPGRRAYRLYVPGGYRGRPRPLVVMLHGCTQTPEDFATGTGMNALAEAETILVAYPEQPRSANQARCWNWYSPADQGRDSGETGIIAGITRAVMDAYAVDPRRVYVAGISAGGSAAANVAVAYPDLYAAVGVHSGLCAGAARSLSGAIAAMRDGVAGTASPIPTIVFHGDRDTTVNPKNAAALAAATGERLIRRDEGQVPNGRAYERHLYADAAGRPAVEHWVIHGSGHAWSGGDPAGSYTDPQGPSATREMWRFFKEHPRRT